MNKKSTIKRYIGLLLYRIKKYPVAAVLSFILTIVLACVLYYFINRIYPSFKPLGNWTNKSDTINFYSGPEGGTYYAIGKKTREEFSKDGALNFKDTSTLGSYENVMLVRVAGHGLGIAQEENIKQDEDIKNNIRVVTPLFLERMHIFYRKDLFKNAKGTCPQLAENIDTCLLRYFADSIKFISAGGVGSGTRILASYLLNTIEKQMKDNINAYPKYILTTESLKSISEKIKQPGCKKDSIPDIIFYVAADTNLIINNIRSSKQYGLMSVNPSLVPELNKKFNVNLRITHYSNNYDTLKDVSTFGTMAYLIASKSIPDHDILQILNKLDSASLKISALQEFGVFKSFEDDYKVLQQLQWKEILIFIFSLFPIFYHVLKFMNTINSTFKKWSFNRMIDDIAHDIYESLQTNVQTLSNASTMLSDLRKKIINLYGDGNLDEKDYESLVKRIDMYLGIISEKKESVTPPLAAVS